MAISQSIVFAAIMAAGSSSRFGATKQLAVHDGLPLARHAAAVARSAYGERVLSVLGHDAGAVLRALGPDAGFAVVNDDYDEGLGSSIACAARACPETADALVVLLVDQPLVTAEHLRELVAAWSGADDEIVATAFDDTLGPPVLFPRSAFDELARLTGDTGARTLLRNDRFEVRRVRFQAAAVDIDLPADLDAIR